jgi:hypothetical protein
VNDKNGDLHANSTIFGIGGRTTSPSYKLYIRISDVMQIEKHTAQPLIPGPGPFRVEIATANLKRWR